MKIKLVILLGFIFLLTGCGWDDIVDEYGDILDGDGVTCSYKLVESNSDVVAGVETISFTANTDGLFVTYNGDQRETLFNGNTPNAQHAVNNGFFLYGDFDIEGFLKHYADSGTCEERFYISTSRSLGNYTLVNTCPEGGCYQYELDDNNNPNINYGENLSGGTCNKQNSIICRTFTKTANDGHTFSIELGFYNYGDQVREYFLMSRDNFNNMYEAPYQGENVDLTVTYNNNYTYTVSHLDKIFFENNGTYDIVSDIKVENVAAGAAYNYFIYSASDDDTLGGFEEGSMTEYNPSITQNMDDEPLPIQEIKFCEETGVLKTFQVVGYLLYIAKIVVPLLLIILGSIDFAKSVLSSDDNAPKENLMNFIKRIIIAIIIFLIPTILNFLLSLVNGASETFEDSEFTNCTTCLFDPFGDCQASDIGS